MHYLPVIGLEIHVQPKTQSKMFCGCGADIFNAEPNTRTCPVCLGLPGALPVPNKVAIEKTILLGLSLNGTIAESTKFDRKNYFYPDLPKGYQISQYKSPIISGGELTFVRPDDTGKTVVFERIHLEEDTGKLMHVSKGGEEYTLIDFNRSGMPLIEIVTGFPPQLHSPEDVRLFLRKLRQYLRYTNVSDANMEEGTMRLEPNVSVAQITDNLVKDGVSNEIISLEDLINPEFDLPPFKVELKNINSFKYAEKAVEFEIHRQIGLLKKKEVPVQETRGWDEHKNVTVSQRLKEEAHDYRYFPEPDIPPMTFSPQYIEKIASRLTETPAELYATLITQVGLQADDAETVLEKPEMLKYFMAAKEQIPNEKLREFCVKMINQPELMTDEPQAVFAALEAEAASAIDDESELQKLALEVIAQNPEKAEEFKAGNENLIQFFMGQIMAKTKGKASPQVAIKVLQKSLRD